MSVQDNHNRFGVLPEIVMLRRRYSRRLLTGKSMPKFGSNPNLDRAMQVQECLEIKLPDDCKRGTTTNGCSPNGSGMFHVHQKSILLHVGREVLSSLSCMIKSDGVVMGCSTFGQIAGILTNGISFFTVQCKGRVTAPHYKAVPALAVAERGDRWVPITGKWDEPMLNSTDILRRVIRT